MTKRDGNDISIEILSAINHRDFSVVELDLVVRGSQVLDDDNQPIVGVGFARRDPIDRANPELGFDLAVARALTNLGQHALRRANGRVKQIDDAVEQQVERWAAKQAAQIMTTAARSAVKKASTKKKSSKVKAAAKKAN